MKTIPITNINSSKKHFFEFRKFKNNIKVGDKFKTRNFSILWTVTRFDEEITLSYYRERSITRSEIVNGEYLKAIFRYKCDKDDLFICQLVNGEYIFIEHKGFVVQNKLNFDGYKSISGLLNSICTEIESNKGNPYLISQMREDQEEIKINKDYTRFDHAGRFVI